METKVTELIVDDVVIIRLETPVEPTDSQRLAIQTILLAIANDLSPKPMTFAEFKVKHPELIR